MKAKPMLVTVTALTLLGSMALAQTETIDNGGGPEGPMFGQNWTEGMNSSIFTDDTSQTLRSDTELDTAWQGMSEADRQLLRDDCTRMRSMSGTMGADASTGTSADAADTGAAATGTDTTGTNGTSTTATMGVSHENMTRLCDLYSLN